MTCTRETNAIGEITRHAARAILMALVLAAFFIPALVSSVAYAQAFNQSNSTASIATTTVSTTSITTTSVSSTSTVNTTTSSVNTTTSSSTAPTSLSTSVNATTSIAPTTTSTIPTTTIPTSVTTSSATTTTRTTVSTSIPTTTSTSTSVTTTIAQKLQIDTTLVTWTSQNGYSAIEWQYLTELTIFHVYPLENASLVYDGDSVNIPSVIQAAHQHGVKVCLAVGGSGTPAWNYNNEILNSPALRQALVENLLAQIKSYGYDCLMWDIENDVPGDFSAVNYTAAIALSKQLFPSNVTIDCTFAEWESESVNLTMIAPYCDNLIYMFDPSVSMMDSYALEIGGTSKLIAGYDLSNDSAHYVPTAADLTAMRNAGYGMFFWSEQYANASLYDAIAQAYYSNTSNQTTTTITTTTTSTSTSTTKRTTASSSAGSSLPSTATTIATTTISSSSGTGGGGGESSGSGSSGGYISAGEGGGGGGGSGSTFRPYITNQSNGFTVYNVTQLGNFGNVYCGAILRITDNFITPTSTGITVNGRSYTLTLDNATLLNGTPQDCYVELRNLSYLPIAQTVTLQFFTGEASNSSINSSNATQVAIPPGVVATAPGIPPEVQAQPSNVSNATAAVNYVVSKVVPKSATGYALTGILGFGIVLAISAALVFTRHRIMYVPDVRMFYAG